MESMREGGRDRVVRSAEMSPKPTTLRERTEEEEFFQEIFGEDKDVDGSRLVDDADYLPMNAIPASTGELLRNELFQRAKRQSVMLMKMRWVLTFKNGWRVTKADARAAFLQGGETQLQRQVFGLPVEELATAMNLPKGRAVQFLKATYGLTVAPREWFLKVGAILTEAGMNRLKTEPCMWSLKAPDMNREDGKQRAVKQFHAALKWSAWEEAPMMHCGVQLQQLPDGGWLLDQEEYRLGLSQVTRDGTGKELTENERSQARAVLGAAQWRAYQSGPQHAAKLSHLQSVLPKGDSTVLGEINKLVREVYGQKDSGSSI
ncbi:unnamed protein product [Effrenium voratum]|nr:unnamed protein product [Effrenium voratum]